MTDEYQIDGSTVAEKDGSGNLVIKNIDEATIAKLASALDANGNDITDGGTTVYDASADTVGDGTTSANHSSLDTEEQSLTNPRTVTESVEAFDEDGDGSTNLSLSLSSFTLESGDGAELGIFVNGNGSGSTSGVSVQVNGQTSGYKITTVDLASLNYDGNASAFTFGMFDTNKQRTTIDMNLGTSTTVTQRDKPTDRGSVLIGGRVQQEPVNSIDITTGFNASGRAFLIHKRDS